MRLPMWRRTRQEQLEEELRSHLEMATRDRMDRGEPSEQAASAARREFGNAALVQHVIRDQWAWTWLEDFLQDLRYAARSLRKNPGFTLVAILTLALGIGANTAIFSLIDTFLMRMLPVNDPQQLVFVRATRAKGGAYGDFTYSTFEVLRDHNNCFSGMFAWDDSHVSVTVDGQPEFVSGDFVSGSYWDVLGVEALLGRTFTAEDDQPGKNALAVISYPYWERRFARAGEAIGKTIYLGSMPLTVIGVTSPKFFGRNVAGKSADVVLPMSLHAQFGLKDNNTFEIMARLNPGISIEHARADLDVAFQQALIKEKGPQVSPQVERTIRAQRIVLEPAFRGASQPTKDFPTELRVLAGAVGIALLIVCVNVVGLLLSRAAARQKEIAVRLALGAARGRLVRQLLAESILLSALGGILGFLFANWGAGLFLAVLSSSERVIPFDLHLDIKVLAFAAGVALLAGILSGLAPALTGTRLNLNPILKGSPSIGSDADGSHRGGLMRSLVVCQVALSLSLVIGAGLLLRTLQRFYAIDTGFERNRVIQMWVFPVLNGYEHAAEMSLYRELFEKFSAIPSVQSATLSRLRMIFGRWSRDVWVPGTSLEASEGHQVYCDPVGPRFFETMGIPLLRGRDFSMADTATSPRVAIISESMARKFFPNEDPVGRHFAFSAVPSTADVEVIGVVKDIRHRLAGEQQLEAAWIPYTQATPDMYGQMNFLVRTAANPASVIPALHAQARLVDKNLPLVGLETQAAEIDEYLLGQRSMAELLSLFAVLALALAAMGLYGTMSYAVSRRIRELGIRLALGAQRKDMLWMVLRETLSIVAAGVLIGVPAALAAARFILSMLFGVEATDVVTIATAILVMCAIALLAGYVPARRATRVDPIVALRYE